MTFAPLVGAFSVITNLQMQFGCNFLKHPHQHSVQRYWQWCWLAWAGLDGKYKFHTFPDRSPLPAQGCPPPLSSELLKNGAILNVGIAQCHHLTTSPPHHLTSHRHRHAGHTGDPPIHGLDADIAHSRYCSPCPCPVSYSLVSLD